MSTTLKNVLGNGTIVDGSLISFSYAEDVTPLEPTSINGGVQQVTAGIVGKSDAKHSDSRLLINNDVILSDTQLGELPFRVKRVSKNQDLITISGDTLSSRLNVTKRALPHGGAGANLYTAIDYYCGLVNVNPVIDPEFQAELEAVPVNFIGWEGNVWEHLKMLCAGFSASTTDNVGIEMLVENEYLKFRKARQIKADYSEYNSDLVFEVDAFDAAKAIEVYNYNTSYGTNRVVYDQRNFDESVPAAEKFQNSVSDSMQVAAGETIRKRFKINATLTTVNQPACVAQITRTPPSPYAGETGQYVIVGVDDLPIQPTQWNDLGGKVTISLLDEFGEPLAPDEIEVTVTAPNVPSLPQAADPAAAGYSPYKIGVESSGEADYPAFWITGTGVFFEKEKITINTGAPDSFTSKDIGATIDNKFMSNGFNASSRGVAAAQVACGPKISVNQTVASGPVFGTSVGHYQEIDNNIFRIVSASFSAGPVSMSSLPMATFADFNAKWGSTADIEDFNNVVIKPEDDPVKALRFNEFSVIPLIKEA